MNQAVAAPMYLRRIVIKCSRTINAITIAMGEVQILALFIHETLTPVDNFVTSTGNCPAYRLQATITMPFDTKGDINSSHLGSSIINNALTATGLLHSSSKLSLVCDEERHRRVSVTVMALSSTIRRRLTKQRHAVYVCVSSSEQN